MGSPMKVRFVSSTSIVSRLSLTYRRMYEARDWWEYWFEVFVWFNASSGDDEKQTPEDLVLIVTSVVSSSGMVKEQV